MDTFVWGRIIWPILEDVAWGVDTRQRPISEKEGNIVMDFFASLKQALPCIYCRQSYSKFFDDNPIGAALREKKMLQWVWLLHQMVNNKLERPEACTLTLEKLKKRMCAWSQAASAMTVWDVLFLVVYNMPYVPKQETKQRIAGIMKFIQTLPYVLGVIPDCVPAEKHLLTKLMLTTALPVYSGNLEKWRQDWLQWVYTLRVRYDSTLGFQQCTPTFAQLLSRYRMATA